MMKAIPYIDSDILDIFVNIIATRPYRPMKGVNE